MNRLVDGAIFNVADRAGIVVGDGRNKITIRCPFHDDGHPSAFLSVRNIFYCSVCTPNGGWSAKTFAEALGVPWDRVRHPNLGLVRDEPNRRSPVFTAQQAQRVWKLALDRALDDDHVESDREVSDYLAVRGLSPAWEERAFGILGEGMDLPEPVSWWPEAGYRVVCPLYDLTGQLVNIQDRAIRTAAKKTQFPRGLRAKGTVFANRPGLRLLRGERVKDRRALLGEGLTDYLALTTYCDYAVLCSPGTAFAPAVVNDWANDRIVVLALDNDAAGQKVQDRTAAVAREHGARRVLQLHWSAGSTDACEELAAHGPDALCSLLDAAPGEDSDVA